MTTTSRAGKPWELEGVSKATYFRRKKARGETNETKPKVSRSHETKCETAVPVAKRTNEATRFKPGNPGKRPGTRNKFTQKFLEAMYADFEAHGIEAIQATRKSKPEAYLAACAKLVPQQVEHGEVGAFAEMDDDALHSFIIDKTRHFRNNHSCLMN